MYYDIRLSVRIRILIPKEPEKAYPLVNAISKLNGEQMMPGTITQDECAQQVRKVGNQVGLLFYHFAKTLVKELGEEQGKALVLKAVHSYGTERGKAIREKVLQAGLELTSENFGKYYDLPSSGWEYSDEGTTYCCYAQAWMDRGVEEMGRLYCEVDFALLKAFNPKMQLKRVGSILDGDPCCKMKINEKG